MKASSLNWPARTICYAVIPVIAALMFLGCASSKVHTTCDRTVDYSRLTNYCWLNKAADKTGDARVDSNKVLHSKLRAAVDAQLGNKHFKKTPAASADFIIGYRLSITEKAQERTVQTDPELGPENIPDTYLEHTISTTYVTERMIGSLVVDIMDAKTRKIIWQSTVDSPLSPIASPEHLSARLASMAGKALNDFPPKR